LKHRTVASLKSLSISFITCLCAIAPSAARAEDLCPKSVAWFSCTLENGKSVSICGSPSTDQNFPKFGADDQSWLQYRYGSPGKIEFKYPEGQGDRLWMKFMNAVDFNPGGTPKRINFSFVTKNTRYLIQGNSGQARKMNYSLAVLSEDPVKTLAEHSCQKVDVDHLLPIALAVPCDPNDVANAHRGSEECR
jgi:hypothetical protein